MRKITLILCLICIAPFMGNAQKALTLSDAENLQVRSVQILSESSKEIIVSNQRGSDPSTCDYTLEMFDSFGDGWNGGTISVFRDGAVVLTDVALDDAEGNDGATGVITFEVMPGEDITTVFTEPGAFPEEITYNILDIDGFVVGSGDPDNDIVSGTITANCTPLSCLPVNSLDATGITDVSADLSWIDDNNPAALSYDLEWGLEGFAVGSGTVEAGLTSTTFVLSGLDPNTAYDFYVTANCTADDSSEITGPFTFTTNPEQAPPGECEYTLEMFDSFGDGWNGALLSVFRNGQVILFEVALDDDPANDGSIGSLTFTVDPDDDITTVLVEPGTFPGEISYNILDVSGEVVGSGDADNDIVTGTITGDCTLSIEDNVLEGFSFFPNPSINVLNVSAQTEIDSINIYNLIGQRVFEQNIDSTNSELDISKLRQGTYIMQVIADGQAGSYKLVKQ